ncbi:MAG: hypothetical protein ACFFBI_03140 [Promethearchaeota archaeon]
MVKIGNKFKINKYITLKLEPWFNFDRFLPKKKTNIYIMGRLFQQCKFLIMDLPIDDLEDYSEIDSIDEVADKFRWTIEGQLDHQGFPESYEIPDEVEFWGHCSNLQAWVESNYDTRLLHSSLSFPLLKRLTEVGDPIAKAVFQKEIYQRFDSLYPTTIKFLLIERYLQYLTDEQKKFLLESWLERDLESVVVFLIGNREIDQFGKQSRSVIMEEVNKEVENRISKIDIDTYLKIGKELGTLLEELDIHNQKDFLEQLLSPDQQRPLFLLKKILDLRQYLICEGMVSEIDFSHLEIFKQLTKYLIRLSEAEKLLNVIITDQVRELFETSSLENMFSLLRYGFYKLIPLPIFREMMNRKRSPFLNNLFDYLGLKGLMSNDATSLGIFEFIFTYLDNDCQNIFIHFVKALPSSQKVKVIDALSQSIKNIRFHEQGVELLDKIQNSSN